jgi:hypothetical protein
MEKGKRMKPTTPPEVPAPFKLNLLFSIFTLGPPRVVNETPYRGQTKDEPRCL